MSHTAPRQYITEPGQLADIAIPAVFKRPAFFTADATPAPIGTEARLCADVARRQALGIRKYGQTVADNPLSLRQWLQHAYEEVLDQAVYLRRAIEEMDRAPTSANTATPPEEPTT